MSVGRILSAGATMGAVCGCAVLALSMAHAASDQGRVADGTPLPSYSVNRSVPAYRVLTAGPQPSTGNGAHGGTHSGTHSTAPAAAVSPTMASATSSAGVPTTRARASATTPAASGHRPDPQPAPRPSTSHSTSHSAPKPSPRPAPGPPPGSALPLPGVYTGSATQVITVVAHSHSSTTATLQAWTKARVGWYRLGPAITAHVGSQGLTSSPSEFRSATPLGSFTLTQAFGAYSDPGTALPYVKTDGADWWISQSGPLYNTHQHCWSGCDFTQGSPNEHLYYEQPYYDYAVVIDTPSGASAYPHGSAFFLHVTDGGPTAGCVAIPQSSLVSIMHWLSPSAHPRILIGVT